MDKTAFSLLTKSIEGLRRTTDENFKTTFKKLTEIEKSALNSESNITEIQRRLDVIENKTDQLLEIGEHNQTSIDNLIKMGRYSPD